MLKKSKKIGKNILTVEIQNVSKQGIWILVQDQEFFLSFKKYPWFQKAAIDQIYDLECHHGKHLHWPSLDVDIEVESLKHPDAYPLVYK